MEGTFWSGNQACRANNKKKQGSKDKRREVGEGDRGEKTEEKDALMPEGGRKEMRITMKQREIYVSL